MIDQSIRRDIKIFERPVKLTTIPAQLVKKYKCRETFMLKE